MGSFCTRPYPCPRRINTFGQHAAICASVPTLCPPSHCIYFSWAEEFLIYKKEGKILLSVSLIRVELFWGWEWEGWGGSIFKEDACGLEGAEELTLPPCPLTPAPAALGPKATPGTCFQPTIQLSVLHFGGRQLGLLVWYLATLKVGAVRSLTFLVLIFICGDCENQIARPCPRCTAPRYRRGQESLYFE